jgi:hypothetical protein
MACRLSLQSAHEEMLQPYERHFQFAQTLTLKLKAMISAQIQERAIFERDEYLTDEKLNSTIRYLNVLMNQSICGNQAKHRDKRDRAQLLSFYSREGGDGLGF